MTLSSYWNVELQLPAFETNLLAANQEKSDELIILAPHEKFQYEVLLEMPEKSLSDEFKIEAFSESARLRLNVMGLTYLKEDEEYFPHLTWEPAPQVKGFDKDCELMSAIGDIEFIEGKIE